MYSYVFFYCLLYSPVCFPLFILEFVGCPRIVGVCTGFYKASEKVPGCLPAASKSLSSKDLAAG